MAKKKKKKKIVKEVGEVTAEAGLEPPTPNREIASKLEEKDEEIKELKKKIKKLEEQAETTIEEETIKHLINELPPSQKQATARWYGETFYPTYKHIREQLRKAVNLD